jgi:TRAP-type transport system small permease protein
MAARALFSRACGSLAWASSWLAVAGLLGILLCVLWQIIGRFILNDTPTWAEALALQLALQVTALGVGLGVREGGHVGLDILLESLPAGFKRAARIGTRLCVAAFGVLMIAGGAIWAEATWSDVKPLLGVPVGVDYIALMLCGLLVVLFTVEQAAGGADSGR